MGGLLINSRSIYIDKCKSMFKNCAVKNNISTLIIMNSIMYNRLDVWFKGNHCASIIFPMVV